MVQNYENLYKQYASMSVEELKEKKAFFESDLEYSYNKLDDPKTDYNDRSEITNSDIPYDKMHISIIEKVLKEVYEIESTGLKR